MDLKSILTQTVLDNFMKEALKQTPIITGNLKSHWKQKGNNIVNDCEYSVIVNFRDTPNCQNPHYFDKAVDNSDSSVEMAIKKDLEIYLKRMFK